MRILYFARDYTTHDYRFLSTLARTAHQIYYLRLEQRGHQLEDRPLPPEVEQIAWRGGRAPAGLWNGPALLADLKRVIHRVKPDLIQAGPLQRSAFLVALAGFRPLVSVSWGYDVLQDAYRNLFWRWATRFTLQHSAALVSDCDTVRQAAVKLGMPAERIVTFPWGIDLEHFSPEIHRSSQIPSAATEAPGGQSQATPFTLLSTRNWEPIYGVETIASAFAQAEQQHPELRLVMLGNGSQAGLLRRILPGKQPDVDCPDPGANGTHRVMFPGQVNYAELPRFYRSADLYVAATHSDGSSISLLEAMACGRPVLVSDIPGTREWVTPGVNGWLFPEGDASALAQAILHALDERQRLPEMGLAARKIAEQRADWSKNFAKLLQAYDIALQGK